MAQPAVTIVGLKEFRRELRAAGNGLPRELGRENRTIGKKAGEWSQSEAQSLGGPHAKFAGMIKGSGTITAAKVGVAPQANAVFWGAKKRTGWNAGNQGAPQHPEWVGAGWEPGVAGQGPYAINDALAKHVDEIVDLYGDAVDRVAAKAFPN